MLERQCPRPLRPSARAEAVVTAYTTFPRAHWRKSALTNPLERINTEIKRRSNVVGNFSHDTSFTAA